MRKITLLMAVLCMVLSAWVSAQSVFINEIHYEDNSPGADINEGVEIAGPAGTDLACYKLVFYNGFNGNPYSTLNLSGTIPNQCNSFGTVWFDLAPIQNGAPDGLALVFDPSLNNCTAGGVLNVVQLLSYEGSFLAVTGDAATMTSVDIGVNETPSTAATNSLQLTGNGTGYSQFTWAAAAASTHDALNNGQTFNGVCGTAVASELRFGPTPSGCYPPGGTFSMEVCATDGFGNVDISYAGTVTLSKASGPGNLGGTLTLPFTNGCATFSGLSFDAAGTYTLNATDGTFGSTSAPLYSSPSCATCPTLTGAHIDACGANEGNNEILFFNSGNFCLSINGTDISVAYGLSNPPATNYTNGFVSNQPYVDALNTLAGCGTALFVDAHSFGHVPPNTEFLLFRSNPINVYDYSNLCGQGPLFCLFSNDPDWNTTGNFKNCNNCSTDGALPRYFRCDFSNLPGNSGCDFTWSYIPCSDLVCAGNGDGLNFGYGGGTMTGNWNACTPNGPLPVLYGAPLQGQFVGLDVELQWSTLAEKNSSHFLVERRNEGENVFVEIGQLAAQGNARAETAYRWLDVLPPLGGVAYRLQQVDMDGETAYSPVIELFRDAGKTAVQVRQQGRERLLIDIVGHGEGHIRLFTVDGRVVATKMLGAVVGQGQFQVALPDVATGLLLYEIQLGSDKFRGKIVR